MKKIALLFSLVFSDEILRAQETTDSIAARADTSILNEVTIKSKKPLVQLLPDRTVVNVDAAVTNSGATLLELLEKSPGVTIDRNGNISLKGRPGVLIMIDGKPSQLFGGDLNTLLSGMTASQIEQIEIMDNPPSKYDAAGNSGVINIKTKKNRQKGFNGNLNLSAAQGKYTRSANTLTLNSYTGKVNIFATVGANDNKNFSEMYALRKYYAADDKTITAMLEQPSFFKGEARSGNLKLGADYFVTRKTTLGLVFSGTLFNRKSSGNNTAIWMNASERTDSIIFTRSNNKDSFRTGALNFNFRHVFDEKKELTADFDAIGYRINNNQFFNNRVNDNGGYSEDISGRLPSSIKVATGKADYSQSFNETSSLEAGWKSSYVQTNNRAAYFVTSNGFTEPDYGKTNHFLYKENINALYASFEKRLNKWQVRAGLRYESTSYDAHQLGNPLRKDSAFSRNYNALFPTGVVSYAADSLNNFSFSFGRRIDRPPFHVLNPFVFVINKYTYETGNPFYRPQYTWNTELTHTFKNILVTSISYSITRDYFSQIFYDDSSGIIIYTRGNLEKMQTLGLSVSTQLSPFSWWSLSGQVSTNHKKITGYVWEQLRSSLVQMNLNVNNQFDLGKGWSAELSGFMQLSEQELQEITYPTGQIGTGVAKQLFNDRMVLKLVFRDIFYSQNMRGDTQFDKATEYFKITRDSRYAGLSLTYRFGKIIKSEQKRQRGGADDEIKRINATS